MNAWQFFIDVGGTFTDVVAISPEGVLRTHKILSSGAIRGQGTVSNDGKHITDPARIGDPSDFWKSYVLNTLPSYHITTLPNQIAAFESSTGTLTLASPIKPGNVEYELRSHEEAPVVAIRYLMSLRLTDPIGPIEVRLGTTRATNALLERKGARTAFVTTKGLADVLKIGYQDRPDLFKLNIRKRDELAECVIEIDERLTAKGDALRSPDEEAVRLQLQTARNQGIEALAICLLHSHVNPVHEDFVAHLAEKIGFKQISISSRLTRLERIVPRGDTTMVDAYLSRTIRGFVASLRKSMPQAKIQLMTSNGGLIDADSAGGKDTILSGPAGGVLGCAHISRAAGFNRVIGFDMGGTSTDVIRIGGRDQDGSELTANDFEYQHETVKAGVRIVTPMLAVETVAAGGGSICAFDGQKLTVGPHSAGADPGPACYGRGGPLTITDMNLFLGRLSAAHFPFNLDHSVVQTKLAALSEAVRVATGSSLTPQELASGFIEIANAHMAAAIRKVSIAKGYDPADYTLTTFGGAGGQHACAIADALHIPRVLCSPYAGVLSALGIGTAPIKRVREHSVNAALSAGSIHEILHSAKRVAGELLNELRADGVRPSAATQTKTTLDVCYAGQSTWLTVHTGSPQTIRAEFERHHRQLYGYIHAARDLEIRVLRVEVSAASQSRFSSAESLPTSSAKSSHYGTQVRQSADIPASRTHTMTVPREARTVPLYTRETLDSAASLVGPTILIEDTSTIVIDPGWNAKLLPGGEILLERMIDSPKESVAGRQAGLKSQISNLKSGIGSPPTAQISFKISTRNDLDATSPHHHLATSPPSPIRLELFNNQFAAIAEQMGVTLRRTALSTNVKERLDFSCAVFTSNGELVVNAPHIPVHLGGMSECVKCLIEDVKVFEPGDVCITNDPFRGGSHLNDITVITPVFVDAVSPLPVGEGSVVRASSSPSSARGPIDPIATSPHFFVASRAHHAEIGGIRPGSMPPESKNLAEEGVLIRAFHWTKNGIPQSDELRNLITKSAYPSRNPDDNLADITAQIAANQTGVHALLSMVSQHGIATVQAYMQHIQTAAESKMRAALRKLPVGVHKFADRMDDHTTIRLAVTIRDGAATFDFTGTDPVHPGNFNANRAIVTSAVMYCLRCLIDEDIPLNAGVLAPVEIILPTCFLNPTGHSDPQQCPAVAAGNVETSQRIVDTIFGALGLVAASQGTMNNLLMGNARFGYYETICGGAGAGPSFHGADAVHTNMTNTRLTDPETLESRYPVRLHRFQIRHGSGGAGQYCGGCGVIREFEFLEPLDVSLITQRRLTAPYGLHGGQSGAPGINTLIRASAIDNRQSKIDNSEILPPIASISVQSGDRLIIETPGGGGWGTANPEPQENTSLLR